MRTTFQESIANEILVVLEQGPLNIRDVADKIERNYFTTRVVVLSLLDDGLLVRSDNNFRNAKVKLVGSGDKVSIIPSITTTKGKADIVAFLQLRNRTKHDASDAVFRIPLHLTRILHTAWKLGQSDDPQDRTLKLIKAEVKKDLDTLKNAVSTYEQILNNPVLWNPDTLRRFNSDARFNVDEIRSAYAAYFEKDETND